MVWGSISGVMHDLYGIDLTKQDISECSGRTLKDSEIIWGRKYHVSVDLNLVMKENWRRQQKFIPDLKPNPGLIVLLESLTRKHGMPIAIGTSSKRERTERILSHLKIEPYLSAVVTSDDVKHHKPYPDIFLEAARRVGVKPREALVVDDASTGIEAAIRAGMRSIGYLTSYNTRQQLSKATRLVKSFNELSYNFIRRM
jgi:HAD superfamily hydrolase (TIGR01509 family)